MTGSGDRNRRNTDSSYCLVKRIAIRRPMRIIRFRPPADHGGNAGVNRSATELLGVAAIQKAQLERPAVVLARRTKHCGDIRRVDKLQSTARSRESKGVPRLAGVFGVCVAREKKASRRHGTQLPPQLLSRAVHGGDLADAMAHEQLTLIHAVDALSARCGTDHGSLPFRLIEITLRRLLPSPRTQAAWASEHGREQQAGEVGEDATHRGNELRLQDTRLLHRIAAHLYSQAGCRSRGRAAGVQLKHRSQLVASRAGGGCGVGRDKGDAVPPVIPRLSDALARAHGALNEPWRHKILPELE
eukprot:6000656-Prymnesium_polylepis.1